MAERAFFTRSGETNRGDVQWEIMNFTFSFVIILSLALGILLTAIPGVPDASVLGLVCLAFVLFCIHRYTRYVTMSITNVFRVPSSIYPIYYMSSKNENNLEVLPNSFHHEDMDFVVCVRNILPEIETKTIITDSDSFEQHLIEGIQIGRVRKNPPSFTISLSSFLLLSATVICSSLLVALPYRFNSYQQTQMRLTISIFAFGALVEVLVDLAWNKGVRAFAINRQASFYDEMRSAIIEDPPDPTPQDYRMIRIDTLNAFLFLSVASLAFHIAFLAVVTTQPFSLTYTVLASFCLVLVIFMLVIMILHTSKHIGYIEFSVDNVGLNSALSNLVRFDDARYWALTMILIVNVVFAMFEVVSRMHQSTFIAAAGTIVHVPMIAILISVRFDGRAVGVKVSRPYGSKNVQHTVHYV